MVDVSDDGSALKVNIDGYGEVEMKPITQGEFTKGLEATGTEIAAEAAKELEAAATAVADEISKTTFAWEGTLSDGSGVLYTDSAESREALRNSKTAEASLVITKADGSDIQTWSGKATAEGKKITITDDETKKTISYTAASEGKDSLKLNIDGYGEVTVKAVTGGDIAQGIEQAAEQVSQSSSSSAK